MEDPVDHEGAPSNWTSHPLEFENRETKKSNPIPPVVSPLIGPDRRASVPGTIDGFLKERYGFETEVVLGNISGKPDGTGYSYSVYHNGEKVAEMEAVLTSIKVLPPGYEGHLTDELKRFQEENSNVSGGRQEDFSLPLWRIRESEAALKLREASNS